MTLREDDVRPLFIDDFRVLAAQQHTSLLYIETSRGIEIYARQHDRVYQLYTRDRTPRRFQSGETARLFARDHLRVRRFTWDYCPDGALCTLAHSQERSPAHDER